MHLRVVKSSGKGAPRHKRHKPATAWVEPYSGIQFVWVPGGSFMMGSGSEKACYDEHPVHRVWLEGFWIGKYLVTRAEFEAVNAPRAVSDAPEPSLLPKDNVSWHDARAFAMQLSLRHGREGLFSLPTEAQWEYAARSGGKDQEFAGGSDFPLFAWIDWWGDEGPKPVGQLRPNGLGLYDMSGNLAEWCEDEYVDRAYATHAQVNPVVTVDGTRERVCRGGAWSSRARIARTTNRSHEAARLRSNTIGFRLVRTR